VRLIPLTFLFFLSALSVATEGTIVQVSRNLRMSAAETAPPKEFYIDLGLRDGIRSGDLLAVSRWVGVSDALTGEPRLLKVELGELVVVRAGESTSVTRLSRTTDPKDLPVMEYRTFMVGDIVSSRRELPTE
jgi:hypothetical protein